MQLVLNNYGIFLITCVSLAMKISCKLQLQKIDFLLVALIIIGCSIHLRDVSNDLVVEMEFRVVKVKYPNSTCHLLFDNTWEYLELQILINDCMQCVSLHPHVNIIFGGIKPTLTNSTQIGYYMKS